MSEKAGLDITRYDSYKRWVLNHRILAPIVFAGTIFTVVVSFVFLIIPDARSWVQNSTFVNESISIVDVAIEVAIDENPGEEERLEIIRALYRDLAEHDFSAGNYFAPRVDTYYLVHNLTPDEIDGYYEMNSRDFREPRTKILGATFSFSSTPEGHRAVAFWSDFTCYRNDKQKRESCRVLTEIIFDSQNKIVSLNDLKIENLKFTEQR